MEYCLELNNGNKICVSKTAYKERSFINRDLSFHFAFNGCENFFFKKRTLAIFPDSFLTLSSGTVCAVDVNSPYPVQLMSVYFSKEFVADFKRSLLVNASKMLDNPAGLDPSEDLVINETIHPFIGDMKYNIGHLNDLVNSNSQDELLISEHLYHALLNYHSLYKKEIFQIEKNLSFLQKGTREEIYRRLNLAREYIYSNYNQSINLKDLASYSCMSVTHLIRTFKQAYDMTPHQFLMQIRLNRSRLLLRSTNYPINEVVNLIGFDSTSTFIKLFRQRYDTTPLKYRRSNSISIPA